MHRDPSRSCVGVHRSALEDSTLMEPAAVGRGRGTLGAMATLQGSAGLRGRWGECSAGSVGAAGVTPCPGDPTVPSEPLWDWGT